MQPGRAPARSKKRSKKRRSRRVPLTREGWWFLFATLVVGAAAFNAGINLMFLVFGMMICLILANGFMSWTSLWGLDIRRRHPAAVHAGTPYLMGIGVRNIKRRLPTFSLEVEDSTDDRPVDRRCYFLKLPAGREQETAYRNVIPERGLHRLTGFRITTRFPFGLIRNARELPMTEEIIVYPALVPVSPQILGGGETASTAQDSMRPNRSGDFHGLRDYQHGEDPRQIHWRASARRGRLLLRENEDDTGRVAMVILDEGEVSPQATHPGSYEAAVSLAASAALVLLRQGFEVGLCAGTLFLGPSAGNQQGTAVLKALAQVQPAVRPEGGPGGDDLSASLTRESVRDRLRTPTGSARVPPDATLLRIIVGREGAAPKTVVERARRRGFAA
jgi:uncharacterized protein (DUF58 family)